MVSFGYIKYKSAGRESGAPVPANEMARYRRESFSTVLLSNIRVTAAKGCIGYDCLAEGARFETPDGTETIGRDLLLSVRTQSLTEDLEAE